MKRVLSKICVALALIMLVAPIVQITPAAQACCETWHYGMYDGLYARRTASMSGVQVGCFMYGSQFVITKKTICGGYTWGYISSCTARGSSWGTLKGCWVPLNHCRKGGFIPPVPQPPIPPQPPYPPVPPIDIEPPEPAQIRCNENWAINYSGGCYVRRTHGSGGAQMGCLSNGSTMVITIRVVVSGQPWGYVNSCSARSGSWGTTRGGWVPLNYCLRR